MKPKNVVILGAGISGLATAWFLKQKYQSNINLTIAEEGAFCGGWIQTSEKGGYLFEQGPRSFRTRSLGNATIQLIDQLDLRKEIISADSSSSNRFIFTENELQQLPNRLWKVPFSPLTKGWLHVLWNEWNQKKHSESDETIFSFFSRHIGVEWTERFIDPLVSGIFAGDIRQLSIKSCFPQIYEVAQNHESLLKGFLFDKKVEETSALQLNEVKSPLFTFKGGMRSLIDALATQLKKHIVVNVKTDKLVLNSNSVQMQFANGTNVEVDHLISTIPTYRLAALLNTTHPFLAADLNKINYASVMVVNLGYNKSLLKQKGFGYLIPSKEQEKVLGCIWDSAVFPQQNSQTGETRLTLMLGGTHHPEVANWSEEKGVAIALAALEKQLGISDVPNFISAHLARQAIPQYAVGHADLVEHIQQQISFITPGLTCIGSAFNGVSVSNCIERAYEVCFEKN